jgi:hypothetical protein
MSDEEFIQQYETVLMNLELAIISVYREHPDLSDAEVDRALEFLERTIRTEATELNEIPAGLSNPLSQEVYRMVRMAADFQLGRLTLVHADEDEAEDEAEAEDEDAALLDSDLLNNEADEADEADEEEAEFEPVTAEEMRNCFKRIRRSIRHWTKEGGRQGYLKLINGFLPEGPEELE